MEKRVFTFFDIGNKVDPRAIDRRAKIESIIKESTDTHIMAGITDLRKVKDLSVVFDAFEKLDIVDQSAFVHYMLEYYYELQDNSSFGNEIGKGLARETFKDARELIFACVDDDESIEENVLVSYNDDVDVFISYFKEEVEQ